ncbi:unnamed protein product, partial [Prorocentrum cordatum]
EGGRGRRRPGKPARASEPTWPPRRLAFRPSAPRAHRVCRPGARGTAGRAGGPPRGQPRARGAHAAADAAVRGALRRPGRRRRRGGAALAGRAAAPAHPAALLVRARRRGGRPARRSPRRRGPLGRPRPRAPQARGPLAQRRGPSGGRGGGGRSVPARAAAGAAQAGVSGALGAEIRGEASLGTDVADGASDRAVTFAPEEGCRGEYREEPPRPPRGQRARQRRRRAAVSARGASGSRSPSRGRAQHGLRDAKAREEVIVARVGGGVARKADRESPCAPCRPEGSNGRCRRACWSCVVPCFRARSREKPCTFDPRALESRGERPS